MTGRTYRYFTGKPLYPFGFGLSYTTFEVLRAVEEEGRVLADVSNTGTRDGEAVVQVYVACENEFAPPRPRLCGFARVLIPAGGTVSVPVLLDPFTNTVINEDGERVEAARYTLYVGLNQPDERSMELGGSRPVEIRR